MPSGARRQVLPPAERGRARAAPGRRGCGVRSGGWPCPGAAGSR